MIQTAATIDSARAIVAAHHSYTLWGLIAIIVFQTIAIVLLISHKGWAWISTAPTTNIRLLNGIAVFSLFNLSVVLVGYATHTYPPVDVILALEGAILLMCGLDVAQYGVKRWTTDPAVQSNQNVQGGITPGAPLSPPAPPIAPPADVAASIDPAPKPIVPLGPRAGDAPTVTNMQTGSPRASMASYQYARGD